MAYPVLCMRQDNVSMDERKGCEVCYAVVISTMFVQCSPQSHSDGSTQVRGEETTGVGGRGWFCFFPLSPEARSGVGRS